MKVYLDDMRKAPEGFLRCKTAIAAIALLQTGKVKEISLDHDLGEENKTGKFSTGYDVVCWIEEKVAKEGFIPPVIKIHSANPVGRKKIEAAIESIKRFSQK